MKNTLALTPALSPRRGGAKNALGRIAHSAAFIAPQIAANRSISKIAGTALTLLGERAGVRADMVSSLALAIGHWSLEISPSC